MQGIWLGAMLLGAMLLGAMLLGINTKARALVQELEL